MPTLHRYSRTIVTDEDFSFVFEMENPACNLTDLNGPRATGIEITANEFTRQEFGHPERFEKFSVADDRRFPGVSIRDGGFCLITGTLIITSATSKSYSGWLQSELGVLGTAQRDKKITDMPWKTASFVNKTAYTPGDDDYATIPLRNPVFWDKIGRQINDPQNPEDRITYLTERFRELMQFTVNRRNLDGSTVDTGEGCVVSPYLFLNYVVSDLLKINGFFIDPANNALEDPEHITLLIYNNFNIFKQTFDLVPLEIGYFDHALNEWLITDVISVADTNWYISDFSYADLLPRIALKDFILGIQNMLNVAFIFGNDNTVQIINRNTVIDKAPYNLDDYFTEQWITEEVKDVTLKFIQAIDESDELSNDYHDLSERRADFRDPVDTIEELKAITTATIGDLRLVRSENKIYEYKYHVYTAENEYYAEVQTDVLEWIFVSTGQQPFFYGDGEEIEEIKTACSTLRFEDSFLRAVQAGNLASARALWSNFSFRLMHNDPSGYAQSLLNFETVFAVSWRNWSEWWRKRKSARGSLDVPANELYYIVNHITDPYRVRSGSFIIKKLRKEYSGNKSGVLELEVYKR